MNPDVELDPDALARGARGARARIRAVGLVAPAVRGDDGERAVPLQALSLGVGALPARLRAARRCASASRATLARYEMRDVIGERVVAPRAARERLLHARCARRSSAAWAASIRASSCTSRTTT